MLAKLQAAAAAKRQQRVEVSAFIIQRAWRRHCSKPAPAMLRRPPPLPAYRRPVRVKRAPVRLHAVAADRASAQLPTQRSCRSTRTAKQRRFGECSCITSPPSSRSRDSVPESALEELHLSPVHGKCPAPQERRHVQRRMQTLVAPPPLPARDVFRAHARRSQRYGTVARNECVGASRCPSSSGDANVPTINNDIYKMLR
eukprot:COSAG02_NODE_6004_length_3881_cov_46.869117_2_plen_200_part_00